VYNFLNRALIQLPQLESVDAQMVMRDLYETEYGLFNHLAPHAQRPLAAVALHKQEDLNTNSSLEYACRLYVKHRIYDVFHLNVLQFLDLPPDVIEMLIVIAKEQTVSHNKAMAQVEKEMQVKV
jgi:hypothetical protein